MNQLAEALAGELPGPPVRALYVYNCNPAAVAPDQRRVLEGLLPRRPVHRRPRAVRHRHGRLRRHRPARDDAARTRRHPRLLRPPLRHAQPPGDRPGGEARSNNDVFRALAGRLGFEPELFPDDETLIREALDGGPTLAGITLERLRAEGSIRLDLPERLRPVRRRRLPDPLGQVRAVLRADERRRPRPAADLHPAPRRPADPPRPRRRATRSSSSARPGRSSSTRPSPRPPATAPWPATRRSRWPTPTPTPAGLVDGDWAEVYNDRGRFLARVALTGAVQAGRGGRDGHLLEQAQPRRRPTPTAPPRPP